MSQKAVITGLDLCTIAGMTLHDNIINLNKGQGLTLQDSNLWSRIQNTSLNNSDSILGLIRKAAFNALSLAGLVENNILNEAWYKLKTSLVCGSNFFETNIWEDSKKDKSMLWNYNYSINKLASELKINRGVLNISTACSSGASAIVSACQLIESGESDIVLVCGYDFRTQIPENGMSVIGALSKSGIRPFSIERTGTDLAEGIGVIILESYEYAKNRNADIYAQILGYGITNDAYNITAPNPSGEALEAAMNMAVSKSGLDASDIQYINAHGSGTKMNDVLETTIIKSVFGEHAYRLYINSSKSIIGHTLGAAGLIEAIITAAALKHGCIHPTANFIEADPECDLNYCTQAVITDEIKSAISNSVGFGGINASILLKKGD